MSGYQRMVRDGSNGSAGPDSLIAAALRERISQLLSDPAVARRVRARIDRAREEETDRAREDVARRSADPLGKARLADGVSGIVSPWRKVLELPPPRLSGQVGEVEAGPQPPAPPRAQRLGVMAVPLRGLDRVDVRLGLTTA